MDLPPNHHEVRRKVIDFRQLSNFRLPIHMVEDLIETGYQLLIQVNNDGSLNLSLVSGAQSIIKTQPYRTEMKNRPAIQVRFPQRDEEKRRELFAKPRLCDYLGNEKAKLVEIAKSGDLRDKYRMRTYIDAVDNQIAKYFGCNLYSLKWDKRPRITSLSQFYDLYEILPHKILHLVNLIAHGSSLILHRRSQRLATMPRENMSRLERWFYYCPSPSDGYYPVSFEDEKENELISFALNETVKPLLTEKQKVLLRQELDRIDSGLIPKSILVKAEEIISFYGAERYRSARYNDPSSLGYSREVPYPGKQTQKLFLRELWADVLQKPIDYLQKLFKNTEYIEPVRTAGSEGYLSPEGRLRVKYNLRIMYKYYLYVKHRVEREDCPYWQFELRESLNIIIVNLMIWKTNSIEPFKKEVISYN